MPDAPAPPAAPTPAASALLAGIGIMPNDPADVPDPAAPVPDPAAPVVDPPAGPPAPAGEPDPDPSGAQNPDAYQRAIAAERKRAKDANAEARRLQAELDARETAAKPLEEQVAEANQKAKDAALIAVRYEIAAKVGLDLSLASRLSGSTREEIEADAAAFKAQVGTTPTAPLVPPEGGVRTTPEAKPDPATGHNALILELLTSRSGSGAAGSGPSILAGLEPAPAD
jgi:hypothetical protein